MFTNQLIILLLCPLIINCQLDCCKQNPTRMTIQSIIKQPSPLIVNSQIKPTEIQSDLNSNNSPIQSSPSSPSSTQPTTTINDESRKSISKINSYEMIPMIESSDWTDYPSNYPASSYSPNNQHQQLTPTYHRYDYNRLSPYHPSSYHPSSHHYPPPPPHSPPSLPSFPIHHPPFDLPDLPSSSSKSHIEEIALFIVVLTIAGLFGLLIAMFIPFILLLQTNKATLIPTNSIVPSNQGTGSSQGLIGKRKKRNLIESLQILKSIHETSQRYQH